MWSGGDRCRSVDDDNNNDGKDDDNRDDDEHGIDDGSSSSNNSNKSSGVDEDCGKIDGNSDRNHNNCNGGNTGDNGDDNDDSPFICLMGGSSVSTTGSAQEGWAEGLIEGVVGV